MTAVSSPARPLLRFAEAAVLFLLLVALLAASSREVGLTFDEPFYFEFADSVRNWVASGHPSDAASLQRFWAYDTYHNPHPPFVKILNAVSAWLLEGRVGFPLDYRLGGHVYLAACGALLYGLLRARFSPAMSALAVACVVLPPRVFGDMLIGTTDAPIAISWAILCVLQWTILTAEGARVRAFARACFILVYGAAVATKFPGLLAIVPCGAYCLYRRRFAECAFLAFAVAYGLGFLLLVSPQMWHAPLQGFLEYAYYPFTRSSIPIANVFFGRVYGFHLPWTYFGFMSLITYPVALWLLLPGVIYATDLDRQLLGPLAFALAFWLVLGHLPSTPKHDGVRQFLSVYPILSLIAWVGLRGYLTRWKEDAPRAEPAARIALPAAVFAALGVVAWRSHPHELSYYNALIGGIRGAESSGMEISYFFEPVGPRFVETMNREIPDGATVQIMPDWPPLLIAYRLKGVLVPAIRILPGGSKDEPDYRVVLRRRANVDDDWYNRQPAIYETRYDGVSLAKLVKVHG